MIYTIGRQYGSGGREVGRILSKKLSIPFYDRELLDEAAKDSNYSAEVLENFDEKKAPSLIYALVTGIPGSYSQGSDIPIAMQTFLVSLHTIERIADEEGSCVFIGRCADYVLKDRKDVVNAFIVSSLEDRIKTVTEREGISADKAKTLIKRIDKNRAGYYNYYTDQRWGDVSNYDICMDSGKIGMEGAADLIIDYARKWEK